MRKIISLFIAVIVALSFIGVGSAQSVTGKSTLTLSGTSATLAPGGSLSVNYTMRLINGTGGPTFIILANSGQLTSAGIVAGLSLGSGTPTFNGALNIKVAQNTTPGTYNIEVETGGADPSGSLNFTLTVSGSSAGTTVVSTVPATTPSTAPTTVYTTVPAGSSPSGGSGALALAAILVIVVIAVIAVVVLKSKKG